MKTNAATTATIRTTLAACLGLIGWTAIDSTAIATKTVQTAVGEKEAHAYLQDWGDGYILAGDYSSEGRNVLESNGVLIAADADDADLMRLAGEFAAKANKAMDESFARRLYLARPAVAIQA